MTSTLSWLETYNGTRAALVLVIEGVSRTYATTTDGSLLASYTGAAAPWSSFTAMSGGMMASGTVNSAIKLYAPDIDPDSIEFTVVDADGYLAQSILRERYSGGNRTYLTSSVVAGSTSSISVKSTTGFAASGTIYIGDEAIAYTGVTATTFTGITRGVLAVNQTNGGANFSSSHLIGNNVAASAATAPAVTDYPKTWYGRFAHLMMHVRDPLTGTFNIASDACKLWSGRIDAYSDDGQGRIVISCRSAIDLLNKPIGGDQWRANVNEGVYLDSTMDMFGVGSSMAAAYSIQASLGATGQYSHSDVARLINTKFDTWRAAVSTRAGDIWSLELIDSGDGNPPRYQFCLRANSTAITDGSVIEVHCHKFVWKLLGWNFDAASGPSANVVYAALQREKDSSGTYTGRYVLSAPEPPVIFYFVNVFRGVTLYLSDEISTFVEQDPTDVIATNPNCNGVVQISGGQYEAIYAVEYDGSGATPWIKILGALNSANGTWFLSDIPTSVGNGYIRLGDATEPPVVKQVIFYRGSAGTLLLKMLLSTGGASGYNHATYDTATAAGFGAGAPASLVDVDSWEELNDVQIQLLIAEPRPFFEHLEPVLAVSGRYAVWRADSATAQPKIAIVRPSTETVAQSTWSLTESNKATRGGSNERITTSRASDGLINRVVIETSASADPSMYATTPRAPVTITVDDLASQSDYGRKRTVTIKAPFVTNAAELAASTLAPALAYFSRPIAQVSRSFNAGLYRMAPGDTATIIDNYLIDPSTGARGATVYAWVLNTAFDLATGIGKVTLVFLPEKDVNWTGTWAPSARVDETATTAGYVAGTKTLTFRSHEFSPSTSSTTDVQYFAAGDKVHIYELNNSTPLEWTDTIASVPTSTTAVLTTGLAGWDTTKLYIMHFDDINTVTSSQRAHTFLALDITQKTAYAANPHPYEWGHRKPGAVVAPAIDYTLGIMDMAGATVSDAASIHYQKYTIDALNNLLCHKTRQVLLNEYFPTALTQTGTTLKNVASMFVPFYGHVANNGTRGLVARVRATSPVGQAGNVRVYVSATPPTGTSFTDTTFPSGSSYTTFTTAGTGAYAWSDELTLTPSTHTYFKSGLHGCWITLLINCTAANAISVSGLFVAEASL